MRLFTILLLLLALACARQSPVEQLEQVRDQKKAELQRLKQEAAAEAEHLDRELAELQQEKAQLAQDEEQARGELRKAMKDKGWVFLGRPDEADLFYQKESLSEAEGVLSFKMLSTSTENWRWTEVRVKRKEQLWWTPSSKDWEPLPEGLELPAAKS